MKATYIFLAFVAVLIAFFVLKKKETPQAAAQAATTAAPKENPVASVQVVAPAATLAPAVNIGATGEGLKYSILLNWFSDKIDNVNYLRGTHVAPLVIEHSYFNVSGRGDADVKISLEYAGKKADIFANHLKYDEYQAQTLFNVFRQGAGGLAYIGMPPLPTRAKITIINGSRVTEKMINLGSTAMISI